MEQRPGEQSRRRAEEMRVALKAGCPVCGLPFGQVYGSPVKVKRGILMHTDCAVLLELDVR